MRTLPTPVPDVEKFIAVRNDIIHCDISEVSVLSWWFLQAECCEDAPAEAPCPGSQEGSAEAHALFAFGVTGWWQMSGPCRHAQTLRVVSGGVSGAASTES